MEMTIPKVADFVVTGRGEAEAWGTREWLPMARVGKGGSTWTTRSKVLYSTTGIYFLVDCEDRRLTCTLERDLTNLFTEDVVEIFLQPDATQRLYLEYEISPLGFELPIMVPNDGRRFMGWLPWQYEGKRVVQRGTSVRDGRREPGAECSGWMVEIMIPFALLQGCAQVPPAPGTRWRGNLYRIDFDDGPASQWAWCPDTDSHFHDYRNFGTLVFG